MIRHALLGLTAAAVLAAPAFAGDYKVGPITVQKPWSRPAQAGMNGVGFMTILNTGKTPIALVGVESPAAGKVEVHQSSMAGGVMTMRKQDRVAIAPGGKLELASGGYHIMLLGLKAAQKAGQKTPVTLVFDNGRKVAVDLTVQLTPPQQSKDAGAEHQHH